MVGREQAVGRGAGRRGATGVGAWRPARVHPRAPRCAGVRLRVSSPAPLDRSRVRLQAAGPARRRRLQRLPPPLLRGERRYLQVSTLPAVDPIPSRRRLVNRAFDTCKLIIIKK
jgi:hypothetical protein